MAARQTRKAKRFEPEGRLMARWRRELQEAGWSPSVLRERLDAHRIREAPGPLTDAEVGELVDWAIRPDGELATAKVFNRAEVIVAVAPGLFGRPTEDLRRVVERVLAHPEVLPMVGVAGARDRHYTLASVVAVEQAIAAVVADGTTRRSHPPLPEAAVARAVGRAQERLGHRLSRGQLEAVVGICRAGRPVSVVVGVAGSGKTTALAAVADAYGSCGYRVLGTATSGQAARTLGREAALVESRTVASLRWRLDHRRLCLDRRSVVIVDEAGMTDDGDLLAVLTQARAAGAKVVLVGDDRQLGPVGPGGALGALLTRLGGGAHVLDENLRQADPAERAALEELRSGEVARAVAWYGANDRIRPCPERAEAIAATVEGWMADTLAGRDSVMLAWRKQSVRALNEEARQRWAEAGRLSGPDPRRPRRAALRGRPRRHPRTLRGRKAGDQPARPVAAVDPEGGRPRCARTTPASSSWPETTWAPTGSPTPTPSPSIAARASPPTPVTTWPTAADGSSPTSPPAGPAGTRRSTPSPTTSTRRSRTSLGTGRRTAGPAGPSTPAPPPPVRNSPSRSRWPGNCRPPSTPHVSANAEPSPPERQHRQPVGLDSTGRSRVPGPDPIWDLACEVRRFLSGLRTSDRGRATPNAHMVVWFTR